MMAYHVSVRSQRPTPLMEAVQEQNVELVRRRIEAGHALDARDSFGQTALHWAAKYESAEIVRLLVEAGANPRAKDEDGETPLQTARNKGRDAIAEILARDAAARRRWWQFWR